MQLLPHSFIRTAGNGKRGGGWKESHPRERGDKGLRPPGPAAGVEGKGGAEPRLPRCGRANFSNAEKLHTSSQFFPG